MTQDASAPTGLTRRRRRLSDEETEQRMLQAALAMVNQAGLTVSLDHISFEDVIRDAGVSRSAVYRRWPYKDLFFSDLLRELARGSSPAIVTGNPEAIEAVRRTILDHLDWLETPAYRRALAAEVLRKGALNEFEIFRGSAEWRTYFALNATFLSLPDSDLRREVQARSPSPSRPAPPGRRLLRTGRHADRAPPATRARRHLRDDRLPGQRHHPRPGHHGPRRPWRRGRPRPGQPLRRPGTRRMVAPALGIASIAMTFIEPDPAIEWTDEHTAEVRAALMSADWLGI